MLKPRKSQTVIFAGIALVVIGAPILVHQWKIRSDRAVCRLNIRNMFCSIYSYAGMNGISPGDPFPGGALGLLKLNTDYPELPKCPSGGTYSFGSDTTYFHDINKDIRCSHAKDLDHFYPEQWR